MKHKTKREKQRYNVIAIFDVCHNTGKKQAHHPNWTIERATSSLDWYLFQTILTPKCRNKENNLGAGLSH